jgi:hypothetical protein
MIDQIERSCVTCKFVLEQREPPPSIQKVLVCRRSPPVAILLPTGPGQYQSVTTFPVVGEALWCYQWQPYLTGSVKQIVNG